MQGEVPGISATNTFKATRRLSIAVFFLSVCISSVIAHALIKSKSARHSPYALYDVVSSQVEAFQRSDYSAAYLQAARHVRGNLALTEFTGMVNAHYLPLLRARRIEFGSMQVEHSQAKLKVYLIDSREIVTPCVYYLVSENGEWKISGVRMHRSWPEDYRLSGLRA